MEHDRLDESEEGRTDSQVDEDESKDVVFDLPLHFVASRGEEEDEVVGGVESMIEVETGSVKDQYSKMINKIAILYRRPRNRRIGSIHAMLDEPVQRNMAERLVEMMKWLSPSEFEPWKFWIISCCTFYIHGFGGVDSGDKFNIIMRIHRENINIAKEHDVLMVQSPLLPKKGESVVPVIGDERDPLFARDDPWDALPIFHRGVPSRRGEMYGEDEDII